MLVDLGRNDVGRVARPGNCKSYRFDESWAIFSCYAYGFWCWAIIDDKYDMFDLFMATFYSWDNDRAPKIRAMELIAQFEGIKKKFLFRKYCIFWIWWKYG